MNRTRLVKFIYTTYLQKSTLHSLAGRVLFSAAYNMSQSGLGTGGSSEEDRRPICGQFDSEGWVVGLHDYVTSMKD